MKLLCISPGYWPAIQFGGPIVSIHNLNKTLVRKGIDVTVYASTAGLKNDIQANQKIDVDGVKVIYFDFVKLFDIFSRTGWQFSLKLNRALKRNLNSFDIIHINATWNYPSGAAAYYCRKYKKPYIIAPRGTVYPYTLSKLGWKKLPYFKLITKRDLQSAAAIHYTTEDELEKCHEFLGLQNEAIIVPNGIDVDEFNNLPSKEMLKNSYPALKNKKVLLFLGRINWKKGLDILSKAYGKIKSKRNDVHLLIVGNDEGGYERKVKKWLEEEGVLKDVTFTGMLKGRAKLEAFAGSDLFILPSYSENFGMAVVEAMACGLPIIISCKVGICHEVRKNDAGIVIDTDAESLYKGIQSILDNKHLASELSVNGKKLVKDYYDIDKVADKMNKAYENILDEDMNR